MSKLSANRPRSSGRGATTSQKLLSWRPGSTTSAMQTGSPILGFTRSTVLNGSVCKAAPGEVVALVAYHSAAQFEAEERGLAEELARFPAPDQDQLDVLTLIDMSTSPTGEQVPVNERLAEILARYPEEHPVHRAVSRSRGYLAESANRAAKRLGLADVRTGSVL